MSSVLVTNCIYDQVTPLPAYAGASESQELQSGQHLIPAGRYHHRLHPDESFEFGAGVNVLVIPINENGIPGGTGFYYCHDTAEQLISGLCWAMPYGNRDSSAVTSEQATMIQTGTVVDQCEKQVRLAQLILGREGYQTRLVSCLTAEAPNGWDDGHSMLEVNIDGQWLLYCMSQQAAFDAPLRQVVPYSGQAWRIMAESRCDWARYTGAKLDTLATYLHNIWGANKDHWQRRLFGYPGIEDSDGNIYFAIPPGMPDKTQWIDSLSSVYKVIGWSEWNQRFYGGQAG